MDGLVNGAILGAVVALAYGILALITAPIGVNSLLGGLGGLAGLGGYSAFGIGDLIRAPDQRRDRWRSRCIWLHVSG